MMKNITICLVYFRSLSLANLQAALYTLSKQDFSRVNSIAVFDNNTGDSYREILGVINEFYFPVPVVFSTDKHGNKDRTHAWSTNKAVCHVETSWVLMTRADYLLAFDVVEKFVKERDRHHQDWDGFITGYGSHLSLDIKACDQEDWRERGPVTLPGTWYTYTDVDTGVWLARRDAFDRVGGLDERLTAWGHAQTHFQWKLYQTGTEFVQIPEVLFFHPDHGGEKDLDLAHRQLAELGVDLREMWSRSREKVY